MSIKIVSIGDRNDSNMLTPAPSLRDEEYIRSELEKDTHPKVTTLEDLTAAPLKILTSHRGVIWFLEGGVTVFYHGKKYCNEYSMYEKGPASARITWAGGEGYQYNAEVEFL
jgi:hypothetical protein